MSVDDLPIVEIVSDTFDALLDRANRVKPPTSIDPPLHLSDFESDIRNITLSDKSPTDNADTSTPSAPNHAAVEHVARQIFYDALSRFDTDPTSFTTICNLLDLLQFCADASQCDISLPLWLVEELLGSRTISGCKRVFDYLESRRNRMITNDFPMSKQLVLLRSCNELLRRLSRSEDAVFCGRVFMFLFQSFPLGDKSSVNLRGTFHTENVTVFDQSVGTSEGKKEDSEDKMDVDVPDQATSTSTAAQEDDKKITTVTNGTPSPKPSEAVTTIDPKQPATDTLYRIFWSLQSVFSNPSKLFTTSELSAFKTGLEATITRFKTVPKVLQTHGAPRAASASSSHGIKRKRGEMENDALSSSQGVKSEGRDKENDASTSNFNPKYLTSRDLFELEISDLTFQRHILVQALIAIDFLLSLTPKAKKKASKLKAQKALIYAFTLSPEDTTWALQTRQAISTYLTSAPEGKFYNRMIDTVLARDRNWVSWKTESCPSISLPAITAPSYSSSITSAKKYCQPKRLRPTPVGSMDLSFLTEDGNAGPTGGEEAAKRRLEVLKDPKRFTMPSLEASVKEVQGLELDIEFLGDTEEDKNEKKRLEETKGAKTWRVLRLAARRRFDLLGDLSEKDLTPLLPKAEGEEEKLDGEGDGEDEKMEDGAVEEKPDADTPVDTKLEETNGDADVDMADTAAATTSDPSQQPQEASEPTEPTEPDAETTAPSIPTITTTSPPPDATASTAAEMGRSSETLENDEKMTADDTDNREIDIDAVPADDTIGEDGENEKLPQQGEEDTQAEVNLDLERDMDDSSPLTQTGLSDTPASHSSDTLNQEVADTDIDIDMGGEGVSSMIGEGIDIAMAPIAGEGAGEAALERDFMAAAESERVTDAEDRDRDVVERGEGVDG